MTREEELTARLDWLHQTLAMLEQHKQDIHVQRAALASLEKRIKTKGQRQ